MNQINVYITGASRGIGAAIAKLFISKGAQVVISSRNPPEWTGAHWIQADLGRKQEAIAAAEKAIEILGKIDILVNNAGLYLPGGITTESDKVFETLLQVNVASAYHTTRCIANKMKELNSGHIFNMCSIASEMGYANGGSYTIAKHALLGMGRVLRDELKPFGVRVTNILPGAVLTDSWAGVSIPEERFINPNDVAHALLNCFELSNRSVVEELVIRPQLGDL
jgi:NAD(P)-dependent dehydrogenase (short-subunit alcohol dehydrogenase family)